MNNSRYLIYCIFADTPFAVPSATGINGRPVIHIASDGLCAAVSQEAETVPDRSRLLAYEKIVSLYHSETAVIPLRYGCVVDSEGAVLALLQKGGERYRTLLRKIGGCAEMGIRVLIPKDQPATPEKPVAAQTGRDYLLGRRAHYSDAERISRECRTAFSGLFRGYHSDMQLVRRPQKIKDGEEILLSLYFLVPSPSLPSFRTAFQGLNLSRKSLLSGPWPPYNFVME